MTMKILVLSDSHSALSFMFRCVNAVKPDAIVHLGDHYDDGEALGEEFPNIPIYQVPGNCDRYRAPFGASEILILPVLGVNLYMTHGHRHNVKFYRKSHCRCPGFRRSGCALRPYPLCGVLPGSRRPLGAESRQRRLLWRQRRHH